MGGTPDVWPQDHFWVDDNRASEATCYACKKAAEKEKTKTAGTK
jgi:hypothetical protein